MKYLISTLWFVLILSSTSFAGVEYVTEEVCLAPAGCRIIMKTGECPECVIRKREVVHTHKEVNIIKKEPFVKVSPKKKTTGKKKWKCIIGPCDWIDKNGNLQWRKYYGGTNNDRSYDAIETGDGDVLIIGTSESLDVDISSPKGSYDIWAILVNSKGEMIWENSFGGSGIDQARAVIKDFSGIY